MEQSAKNFFFSQWNEYSIFCVYHYPLFASVRRQILYIQPFGDEMNKSRRTVSLMAKAFAETGTAVLIIDLFGCGDSGGEFMDACWETWIDNLHCAYQWLQGKSDAPITFWGIRLGCLLMGDFISRHPEMRVDLIMWNPVITGRQLIMQLKRQYNLSQIMGNPESVNLKELVEQQGHIEIAGYEIGKHLWESIEPLDLKKFLIRPDTWVIWKEVSLAERVELGPDGKKVAEAWTSNGTQVEWEIISGKPFWNTVEIEECHDLITSTLSSAKGK